jgi:hypothetical protein
MPSACEQEALCDLNMPDERGGVKCRLFGVVLIGLGFLDSLLTLRGGFASGIYLTIIGIGFAFFAVGAVLRRRDCLRELNHEA